MGNFRLRKTIRLAPGIRLNLSRKGISASVGPRGATFNIGGRRGARATVGVPGTGVSYTQPLNPPGHRHDPGGQPGRGAGSRLLGRGLAIVALVSAVSLVLALICLL
ncbi:MAG: DUF4236 domain-containing protein [Burkholderiales bacterium]|nr:DUF4236 domain-containing protein [Burkholderiales bacterium]